MGRTAHLMILALMVAGTAACDQCDAGSGAELARALSAERLELLHSQIRRIDMSRRDSGPIRFTAHGGDIPAELRDLRTSFVSVRGESSYLILSGCMDNKSALFFEGVADPAEIQPRIELVAGERMPAEELWRGELAESSVSDGAR